tara:strand:+ start:248 stop:391 length:144 start_codon:yes stop_codon:yes gene_type:complete
MDKKKNIVKVNNEITTVLPLSVHILSLKQQEIKSKSFLLSSFFVINV